MRLVIKPSHKHSLIHAKVYTEPRKTYLKKNMNTCKPTIIQTRQGPQTHLSVVTQTLFLLVAIYWRHNTIQPFVFHYWGKGRYKAIAYAMLFITDGFTFLCPDNYKRLRVVVTQLWKNQDSFPVFFFFFFFLINVYWYLGF